MLHTVLPIYLVINLMLAGLIFLKSRRSVLSQFYCFCVCCLGVFAIIGMMMAEPRSMMTARVLNAFSVFLFSTFPFFFFHFIVIFLRRYDILQTKKIIVTIYVTALVSYGASLMSYTQPPVEVGLGFTFVGTIFIVIWMSIFFAIGIALLYLLYGRFLEDLPGPRTLIIVYILLVPLLPGPFALSLLSNIDGGSFELFFAFSIVAMIVAVYVVFRYKIIGNSPYDTLRSTLEVMNDVLFKLNDKFEVTMALGGVHSILGFNNKELVGTSFANMVGHSDYLMEYREFVRMNKMKECYFDTFVRSKSGNLVAMNLAVTPIFIGEEQKGFVCVARDISERKSMEDSLRQSEKKFRLLFETVPCGIYRCNPSGTIQMVNEPMAQLLGYGSPAEMIGLNLNKDIYSHPKERSLSSDGTNRNVMVHSSEIVVRMKSGKLITVMENIRYMFDDKDELTNVEGMLVDVTDRKALEDQLRQAQKMESLGTLAGGLAHDFNNVLQIVSASLYSLKKSEPSIADSKYATMITQSIQKGASLVQQVLTFAQKKDTNFEVMEINSIIKKITSMASSTFPEGISVKTSLNDCDLNVFADRTQIEQVILNLCVNARDAMPSGGQLTVTSELVPGMEIEDLIPKNGNRSFVHLSIADTGSGMDTGTLNRIFEPFFTTKPVGKGTGLGLAVVYGIVNTHQGAISVTSEIGIGSVFNIYLPLSEQMPLSPLDQSAVQPVGRVIGSEKARTILAVEDEPQILESLSEILRTQGYTIIEAKDGLEAIEIYRVKNAAIDLVITDLGLPKLSGSDLLAAMKEINPSVKIIVTSGHLDPLIKAKILAKGVHTFIRKPYHIEDIFDPIRIALEEVGT